MIKEKLVYFRVNVQTVSGNVTTVTLKDTEEVFKSWENLLKRPHELGKLYIGSTSFNPNNIEKITISRLPKIVAILTQDLF